MLGAQVTVGWRRRASRVAVLAAVAAAALGAGCGDGPHSELLREQPSSTSADGATSDASEPGPRFEDRRYEPGDCVDWEDGDTLQDVAVVPCTVPHRVEIAGRVDGPESATYPTPEEWNTFVDTECRALAEAFFGRTFDPFGRVRPYGIYPVAESWGLDGTVWCGTTIFSTAPDGRTAEDPRRVDQAYDFAPGTCLAIDEAAMAVVACDQPHEEEIAGRIDLSDLTGAPSHEVIGDRCRPVVDAYLGAPPTPPWQYGYEGLTEASWAAGTRTTHCFVGRFDAEGGLVEVAGSARG